MTLRDGGILQLGWFPKIPKISTRFFIILCFMFFSLASWSDRSKNTRNEEISTSTFQKYIVLLCCDVCGKSYDAVKRDRAESLGQKKFNRYCRFSLGFPLFSRTPKIRPRPLKRFHFMCLFVCVCPRTKTE